MRILSLRPAPDDPGRAGHARRAGRRALLHLQRRFRDMNMVTRRRFLTLAGAAALPLPSFALAGDLVVHGGDAFGSYWRLSLPPGGGEASAETVARIVRDVDLVFSPYREDSELTRFNRAGGDMAIELSEAFADVLAQSLAIAAASGGAFDPTV